MENIILEEFSIIGLNQEYNVELKFVDNKKILVSENGSGKTTILRIFYLFLKKDNKIFNYDFSSISFKVGGETFFYPKELLKVILNEEVMNDLSYVDRDEVQKFIKGTEKIGNFLTHQIITLFILHFCGSDSKNSIQINKEFLKLSLFTKKSTEDIFHIYRLEPIEFHIRALEKSIIDICNTSGAEFNILNMIDFLNSNKDGLKYLKNINILYFPTFRMIEDSISYFSKSDDEYSYPDHSEAEEFFKDNDLIKFGTKDIKDNWQYLTNRIRTSTTEGFLKMSASLLSNILNERTIEINEVNRLKKNIKTIDKVISRLDKSIFSNEDKIKIISSINDNSIDIKKDKALFYIIENILEIYNKEKQLDETIESYCNAINKFFINKKIIFDERTSEIYVNKLNKDKQLKVNKKIDVENLSSGEKQILLFFTKIYLSGISDDSCEAKKYWIIYDEPEISLSIEWQAILIPQILESNRCEFLLCATHSPFIFKNEYKKYTSDLALEIQELN